MLRRSASLFLLARRNSTVCTPLSAGVDRVLSSSDVAEALASLLDRSQLKASTGVSSSEGGGAANSSSTPTGASTAAPTAASAAPAPPVIDKSRAWMSPANLTPSQVVDALGAHIIGQEPAKRAIAVALRNRWRRMQLPQTQQDEIIPKNILMVGPTGCGKTEIARRLAKFCRAPFVKVEATKFTEVGFHGRDVDTIIKDLLDVSLTLVKELKAESLREEVKSSVEERLLEAITGPGAAQETLASFRRLLADGDLDDRDVVVDVPARDGSGSGGGNGSASGGLSTRGIVGDASGGSVEVAVAGRDASGSTIDIGELMARLSGGLAGAGGGARAGKTPMVRRTMKVRDARVALCDAELEKRLASLDLRRDAVTLAEQNGIVFIDEIDKLISNKSKHSGDASSEGVQRDMLPLIEGTTVEVRRFGNVRTDYMLFVASGAFHEHKPSELLAELQGRLPIRVELKALTAADLLRIMTDTKFNLLEQQIALLKTEGVELVFERDAVEEIARLASEINRAVENIGARRLHTVVEKIMEEISYGASDASVIPRKVVVDVKMVREKLLPMLEKSDFSKFIL